MKLTATTSDHVWATIFIDNVAKAVNTLTVLQLAEKLQ